MNVKIKRSAPYASSTQGAVERFNRTLRDGITSAMGEYGSKKWVHQLHHIVGAYNRTRHGAHQMTPMMVHRGRDKLRNLDAEIDRRLRKTAAAMKRRVERQNAKANQPDAPHDAEGVNVGDKVLVLLKALASERAKGNITAAAEAKRQGRRGRQYTEAEYTVARVRKRFGDDTEDRPSTEWKYELEGLGDELFARESLLKITDNFIRRTGREGRVELGYGGDENDRLDTMEASLRERAERTQEEVAAAAADAEEEAAAPRLRRSQRTQSSRRRSTRTRTQTTRAPARKRKDAVSPGDVFVEAEGATKGTEHTVASVQKHTNKGWTITTPDGEVWSYKYAKERLKIG